jgi:hypothetical protein
LVQIYKAKPYRNQGKVQKHTLNFFAIGLYLERSTQQQVQGPTQLGVTQSLQEWPKN